MDSQMMGGGNSVGVAWCLNQPAYARIGYLVVRGRTKKYHGTRLAEGWRCRLLAT